LAVPRCWPSAGLANPLSSAAVPPNPAALNGPPTCLADNCRRRTSPPSARGILQRYPHGATGPMRDVSGRLGANQVHNLGEDPARNAGRGMASCRAADHRRPVRRTACQGQTAGRPTPTRRAPRCAYGSRAYR
jgi:hypothetical protein